MRGIPVKEWDAETSDSSLASSTIRLTQAHGQHFGFMLQLEGAGGGVGGEKDVLLRVGSVDVLIKWMNSLATVPSASSVVPLTSQRLPNWNTILGAASGERATEEGK
jgi:hypothetical protein